jgi:hypothetical protein
LLVISLSAIQLLDKLFVWSKVRPLVLGHSCFDLLHFHLSCIDLRLFPSGQQAFVQGTGSGICAVNAAADITLSNVNSSGCFDKSQLRSLTSETGETKAHACASSE